MTTPVFMAGAVGAMFDAALANLRNAADAPLAAYDTGLDIVRWVDLSGNNNHSTTTVGEKPEPRSVGALRVVHIDARGTIIPCGGSTTAFYMAFGVNNPGTGDDPTPYIDDSNGGNVGFRIGYDFVGGAGGFFFSAGTGAARTRISSTADGGGPVDNCAGTHVIQAWLQSGFLNFIVDGITATPVACAAVSAGIANLCFNQSWNAASVPNTAFGQPGFFALYTTKNAVPSAQERAGIDAWIRELSLGTIPTTPTLTALSPSTAAAGGAGFTLTVNGLGFVANAMVRWNGVPRTTTFVSATQLTVAITAVDIASGGTPQVTVANPGSAASNALTFNVTSSASALTSLSPSSGVVGGAGFTLTVNGTGFVAGTKVKWNGSDRVTTFVNSTQLTAAITSADIAAASGVAALRAGDFVNSIGINIHMTDNAAKVGDPIFIKNAMPYLGIKHLRDTTQSMDWRVPDFQGLAADGYKFSFVVGWSTGFNFTNANIDTQLGYINSIWTATPGCVTMLEGQNEPYNFMSQLDAVNITTWAHLQTVQTRIHTRCKAHANLGGVPVTCPSGRLTEMIADYGAGPVNFAPWADYGNIHPYPEFGNAPKSQIDLELPEHTNTLCVGKPVVATEFGYGTAPTDGAWGVNNNTQARHIVNGLLYAFKKGVLRTFVYMLAQYAEGSINAWDVNGIYLSTGAEKPAATAIHNLTTVVADSDPAALTFAPGTHSLTFSNLPANADTVVMKKVSGMIVAAILTTADIWDQVAKVPIIPAAVNVTVNLGGVFSVVKVYDVMAGTAPIATLSNVSSVLVTLTDSTMLVTAE